MELKVGYKQTEVGVIPEDWRIQPLGLLTDLSRPISYGIVQTGPNVANGVRCLRVLDIENGRINKSDLITTKREISTAYKRTILKAGDLVMPLRGKVGEVGAVDEDLAGSNLTRGVALIAIRSEWSGLFCRQFIAAPSTRVRLQQAMNGSALQEIPIAALRAFKIALPPTKPEQEAIAEALSDADALIESLDQLIAKKRQIKQGTMQELLTGKRRLPGFGGEWDSKRLGDLGSTYGGLTGKTKSDFGEGSSRYITFMNVMSNVVIDCEIFEPVRVSSTESQNRAIKGDLFFNGSSETPEEVGLCSVLADSVADVYLNSFCFGFRFREGAKADGLYFAYYFRSLMGRELLKSLAQGATRYNLSKTALLKVAFLLPSLEEQSAIAAVLSDMDTELTALETRLAKARKVKQGMMQELLTGRIRLL